MTTFEPISWLELERYALGELTRDEHARVEERLRTSAEDRACLEQILSDRSELPPLPAPLRARAKRPRIAAALTVLAAAASLLLLRSEEATAPSRRHIDGSKGGEISVVLYSERAGEAATQFSEGERFKLFVTCPPAFDRPLRVLVFQGGERFLPLGGERLLACGNRVPWPGAFTLDGDGPALVCVDWGAADVSSLEELGDRVICARLEPR